MTHALRLAILFSLALAACGGPVTAGDGGADGGLDGGAAIDAGRDAASDADRDGGTDAAIDGAVCTPEAVARLCIRGTTTASGETLSADAPVHVQLYPAGCHSSACTVVDRASCTAALAGTDLTVTGDFCLHTEGECTLPDCSGAGTAECDSSASLPAGDYTARLGGASVQFTVPSTLPFGGACSDVSSSCDNQIDDLATLLNIGGRACTVVVRLDYTTRDILGYHVVCGSYASVDEPAARSAAQSATGFGGAGAMLNEPSPSDDYVFYESPGDFGGAAAVSARTGQAVFGGGIVWLGHGDITHPTTWRPAAELGSGCDPSGGITTRRGWDLRGGTALSAADVDAAVSVVLGTAVPAALWRGGYVFDSVVLLYPRGVGAFDPSTAEWIVLVNGGWLE
ncbi:MAG: hypothetical protein K8H88_30270 [Sandaracinaceae bacterium]|nr:hypothetical protein [Sandaracinaceae bacterium]